MKPVYHRAKHKERGWIVVRVVKHLYGAVLEDGYAVKRSEFSEIDETPLVLEDRADATEAGPHTALGPSSQSQ